LNMYGYVSNSRTEVRNRFTQLISECPDYEGFLILGSHFDIILFFAPGISVCYVTEYVRDPAGQSDGQRRTSSDG
jgi:hypothetical protein